MGVLGLPNNKRCRELHKTYALQEFVLRTEQYFGRNQHVFVLPVGSTILLLVKRNCET